LNFTYIEQCTAYSERYWYVYPIIDITAG